MSEAVVQLALYGLLAAALWPVCVRSTCKFFDIDPREDVPLVIWGYIGFVGLIFAVIWPLFVPLCGLAWLARKVAT